MHNQRNEFLKSQSQYSSSSKEVELQEVAQYQWKSDNNGLYAFVLEGGFELGEHQLGRRDALGIWDTNNISLKATSMESRILLIEVPLEN